MLTGLRNLRDNLSLRFCLICFTAASVSFPMAWISLGKFLLFTGSLVYLAIDFIQNRKDKLLYSLWSVRLILAALTIFSLSLLWTIADQETALLAFVKHAKVLGIILLLFMIRTPYEAKGSIIIFIIFQIIILLCPWALYFNANFSWVKDAPGRIVFAESYIDQSIMFAITAVILWHIRRILPWPAWLSILLSIMAFMNIIFVLPSRSGYAGAIAAMSITFALIYKNNRLTWIILLTSITVITLFAYNFSSQFQSKVIDAKQGSIDFINNQSTSSSAGWRLNAWNLSAQAIAEKPIQGFGVGSWTKAVKDIENLNNEKSVFGSASNPHQEFLLWGVELGILGPLLLFGIFASLLADIKNTDSSIKGALLCIVAVTVIACLQNSALYDDLMGDFIVVAIALVFSIGIRNNSSMQVKG